MEDHTSKESIQQIGLPIKTKIATILIIISGTIAIPFLFLILLSIIIPLDGSISLGHKSFITLEYFIGSLFIVSGIFIFKRKKWAWFFSMLLIIISLLFVIIGFVSNIFSLGNLGDYLFLFGEIIILFVIIVFLLFDRKNFFKIAS